MRQRRSLLAALLKGLLLLPALSFAEQQESNASFEPLDCVINPSVVADLGSSVPGVLSAVQVDRSDFVRKGDVVAKLESSVEQAGVELARTRAGMTAEVDLRRTNAAFGRRQFQRVDGLFRREVVSTNDLDQRRTESKVAQIQLRQARENLRLAELESVRAEEILKRRTIYSPVTGVVMDRFRTIGEYVEDKPIVRVAQLDPLHVEVIVPVDMLGQVKNGMQAEVWSEAVDGKLWQATVNRVDRVADVASGTYGVRLTMDNPDYRIPAGLRCRVRFHPGTATAEQEDWPPKDLAVATTPEDVDLAEEADSSRLCRWFGPYRDRQLAEDAAQSLRHGGAEVQVTQRQDKDAASIYNVVSTLLTTKSDSNAYLARLREAGVEDYFLMGRKQGGRRISLGLYRTKVSAGRRLERLSKLGFDVELLSRANPSSPHWLLVRGSSSDIDPALLAALPGKGDTVPPRSDCERMASR